MSEFTYKTCPICGIQYAAPTVFFEARDDGRSQTKNWYCPNGHNLVFKDSELDKVTRERDRLRQQIAQKDDEIREVERQRLAAERKAKRIQKRAHAGLCPCCNRTFQDVVRHMKHKHPEVALLEPNKKAG